MNVKGIGEKSFPRPTSIQSFWRPIARWVD